MAALVEKSLINVTYWEALYGKVENDTPIVVTLHWMGGVPDVMNTVLYEGVDFPLRVICLQAPYPFDTGYTWYPDGDPFYDRSEAKQAPDIQRTADDLAAFLRELKQLYPAKIAVTGLSQGGDLSLSLAVYHPTLIDLAMPMAGRLSAPMRPTKFEPPTEKLPEIYLQQGADDPIVSVESVREIRAWLESVGFHAELREYPNLGHDISKAMIKDIQQLLRAL